MTVLHGATLRHLWVENGRAEPNLNVGCGGCVEHRILMFTWPS